MYKKNEKVLTVFVFWSWISSRLIYCPVIRSSQSSSKWIYIKTDFFSLLKGESRKTMALVRAIVAREWQQQNRRFYFVFVFCADRVASQVRSGSLFNICWWIYTRFAKIQIIKKIIINKILLLIYYILNSSFPSRARGILLDFFYSFYLRSTSRKKMWKF